jgi:hypothetical protein
MSDNIDKSIQMEVGLDGDQAMKNIFGKWRYTPNLGGLRFTQKIYEAKWQNRNHLGRARWVEGHQDNLTTVRRARPMEPTKRRMKRTC